MNEGLDQEQLEQLFGWIDDVPFSRPKRSLTRDFSDGVLVAELVQHFLPRLVDLHNYAPANSSAQKMNNWGVLQRRVFTKLKFAVPESVVRSICNCKAGVVEVVLLKLKEKIEDQLMSKRELGTSSPSSMEESEIDTHGKVSVKVQVGGSDTQSLEALLKSAFGETVNLSQTVPRVMYEEKEQECLTKDESVEILNAKLRRMEHLISMKESRIKEMAEKLELLEQVAKKNPYFKIK